MWKVELQLTGWILKWSKASKLSYFTNGNQMLGQEISILLQIRILPLKK